MVTKIYLGGTFKGFTLDEVIQKQSAMSKAILLSVQNYADYELLHPMPSSRYPYLDTKDIVITDAYLNLIRERDRLMVKSSDIVIMDLLDAKEISGGAYVEYGWADAFGKPFVAVMEENSPYNHLLFQPTFRCPNRLEAAQVIRLLAGEIA